MRNKLVCFHSVMIISLCDCQKSCLSYQDTNTLMCLVAVLLCCAYIVPFKVHLHFPVPSIKQSTEIQNSDQYVYKRLGNNFFIVSG